MTTATKGGLGGAKAATGVGSGFSAPKTPVMPQLLPKASTTYSDWLVKQMDATLLQENSAQGAKHYREKKETFWLTFADWAASNPKELRPLCMRLCRMIRTGSLGSFPSKSARPLVPSSKAWTSTKSCPSSALERSRFATSAQVSMFARSTPSTPLKGFRWIITS